MRSFTRFAAPMLIGCLTAMACCASASGSQLAGRDRRGPITLVQDLLVPVVGASITSPFGWRIHPILKRRRFHWGVDYAAPRGTPVLAADEGVIEEARHRRHYGLYLRIRHSDRLETAYAHLAQIEPGLHAGMTVHRGDPIGSVGTTGWATGPHLFYEVIVDGERVDPERFQLAHEQEQLASGAGSP